MACFVLLTACQTKTEVVKEAAVTPRPAAAIRQVEAVKSPSTRQHEALSAPIEKPRPATIPARSLPIAEQVAMKLGSSFAVKPDGLNAIEIEKAPATASQPSLFEEAILLGKLRAILKSSTPAESNASVAFQAGKASLTLPPSLSSGAASVLIAKMLSLDGVNELRADFSR